MPLAPKGSKSSINKASNAASKYAPNNPVDRRARAALSRGSVAKGGVIRAPGEVIAMAAPKTVNKANATAARNARKK